MELHGLLLLDKPADLTSHDLVARTRKALGQRSVGHTGTLDPLATGLMIMVLGEATKLSDYLVAHSKSYRVHVRLGMTTDTLDRTGKVLSETSCAGLTREKVAAAVADLTGDFDWPIPLFSAAKVDGKKLYEYGREGEAVERPLKRMSFWNVKLIEVESNRAVVELSCSKGSFIRSWAAQLGEALGVGGVVDELRRLTVGEWAVNGAGRLEELSGMEGRVIPMGQALPGLKSIMVGPRETKLMTNGQIARDVAARLIYEQKTAIATGQTVLVKVLTTTGNLLAILAAEPGQGLKIRRVFRSAEPALA